MFQGHLESDRRRVALIVETSNEYARGLLRGVRAYIREHRPWSLYLSEHSRHDRDLNWLANWSGDGIIARIENETTAEYIRSIGLPCIDLSAYQFIPELPCVETNDEEIAILAAEHLLERGFKHFGFFGDGSYPWSRLRQQYFVAYLSERGYSCRVMDVQSLPGSEQPWGRTEGVIADWVRSIPKPAGIMACFDIRGQQLLEICRASRIAVPEQVAVIGVDNDELLCELADPPLSSIMPDTMKTGYTAAHLLERMMAGETVNQAQLLIKPLRLVTRMSTDVLAVEDKYVADALRFIRNHACAGIDVHDVLAVIPLSRRVLEQRFRKWVGRTPHEEITRVRLKFVQQLLVETDLPVAVIAERAGFRHEEYLSVVFKRNTGMTPSSYRANGGSADG